MGLAEPQFSAPSQLDGDHDISGFDCGVAELNSWLGANAKRNQRNDASRTFIVLESQKVVAFYSLVAGSMDRHIAPKSMQRNMPDPLPVIVLGRLAVDLRFARHGLGRRLVADAMKRIAMLSDHAAIKAMAVHAIDQDARAFYLRLGFVDSPAEELTMFLPIVDIRRALDSGKP